MLTYLDKSISPAGEIPGNGIDDDGNGIKDDVYGANFLAFGRVRGDPYDRHGHGTHCAGKECPMAITLPIAQGSNLNLYPYGLL